MKYLLICLLLVGCTQSTDTSLAETIMQEKIDKITFQSCIYGSLKTGKDMVEQGVLIPDINTDAYLNKEHAEKICKEFLELIHKDR